MTRKQHARKHTQHNNGYLWQLSKARRFGPRRGDWYERRARQPKRPPTYAAQRAQAEKLIARFFKLGYEALWGGGDESKGHGYWIFRGFPSLRPDTTKPVHILLRKKLLCGHFNGGNTNCNFQLHYEAVRILRQLERRAKTKGTK